MAVEDSEETVAVADVAGMDGGVFHAFSPA